MSVPDPPRGCDSVKDPMYYKLCDLDAVWGVAVEGVAAAGAVATFILFVVVLASLPFITNRQRKRMLPLQAAFLVCNLGLFGLALAFVVDLGFATCVARRFVFGVLFAGCLACLVMHGCWLSLLTRGGSRASAKTEPWCWVFYGGALALVLVEVIINTEWLVVTVARAMPYTDLPFRPTHDLLPCRITNRDFVMALIYVMALMLAAVLAAASTLVRKDRRWRRDAVFLLITLLLTAAIWTAWIAMYIYGNQVLGDSHGDWIDFDLDTDSDTLYWYGGRDWDDATIAIALVCNAWLFLVLYVIPETWLLTQVEGDPLGEAEEQPDRGHVLPPTPTGGQVDEYGNIGPDRSPVPQKVFQYNEAFSMDERKGSAEPEKPVSPYMSALQGYGVRRPTELAVIAKGLDYRDLHHNTALPPSSPDVYIPRPGLPHPGEGGLVNDKNVLR